MRDLLTPTIVLCTIFFPACATSPHLARETVPFELVRGQIVLTATVGGTSGLRFLLDTGGDPSAVDIAAARRLNIVVDTSTSGEASGVGGAASVKIYPARIPRLLFGSQEMPEIEALAVDLSPLVKRLGLEIAGVLGFSFLQELIIQIDYPRRELHLLAEKSIYPQDALTVPMRTVGDDRTPILETVVSINGMGCTLIQSPSVPGLLRIRRPSCRTVHRTKASEWATLAMESFSTSS